MSEMRQEFRAIFARYEDYECAIVGSALRDFETAHDIDLLMPSSVDFRHLAAERGLRYHGGFDGLYGRVHSLHDLFAHETKIVNLFQCSGIHTLGDWPKVILHRDGRLENTGNHYLKPGKALAR